MKSNIFYRFGVLKALISDQGSHFYNRAMSSLLQKYVVVHRVATAYHPRQIAKLKYSIGKSKNCYKRWPIPIGGTRANSLRTLYGHTELYTEHRWECLPTKLSLAVKQCNLAYDQVSKQRKFQLQELEELYLEPYENSHIYKQNFIASTLRSRWYGPFVITNVFPYGVVELDDENTNRTFQVNGHLIKLFHEGPTPIVGEMETISLMELASSDDTP
ncbi:hypothetical protein CR513_36595, partial [Mucuna pruriens]